MYRNAGIIMLCFLFILACKPKNDNSPTSEVDSTEELIEIEGEFVKFYNEFHSDSIFQLEHIAFPLENMANDSLGEFWNAENWVLHKPFSDMGGMFKRDITPIGKSLIVEKIIDANGFFEMERRFAKSRGDWQLIYYSVANPALNQ